MSAQPSFTQIPLAKLRPSPKNVRKVSGGIDDLAASIKAHGLRQNLNVERVGDHFEVVAGGRRLRALQQLAKAGELPAALGDAVPCLVVDQADSSEASLAENVIRMAMHPADEFEAFFALSSQGKSAEEIAERFGSKVRHVEQRLTLARVSPKIIKAYRDGKITLDAVEAFSISNDHAAQERVFKQTDHPYSIRQMLTKGELPVDDRRAKFVGVEAYEAAGGKVRRDLFHERNEGYVIDVKLLDRLTTEKLDGTAKKLRAEGWSWVETGIDLDRYRYQDAGGAKADKAKTGAIVTIGWQGQTEIFRGVLKPGQKSNGSASSAGAKSKPKKKPTELSFAQVQTLQAQRCAVLQVHLASNPRIALAALAASLAGTLGIVSGTDADNLVRFSKGNLSHDRLPITLRPVVETSPAAKDLRAKVKAWTDRVPKRTSVFAWLLEQPESVTHELLALCAGQSLMAVDVYQKPRDAGGEFAQAAGLNMGEHWKPTAAWLEKQSTAYIIAAVTEAKGKQAAQRVAGEKGKAAIARAAEKQLQSWVPKQYRAHAAAPAKAKVQKAK